MNNCKFCGYVGSKEKRCPRCGLGEKHPPWELPAWEETSFDTVVISWWRTFWQLLRHPRLFFRVFKPEGSLLASFSFALPFFLLIGATYIGVMFKMIELSHRPDVTPEFMLKMEESFDVLFQGQLNSFIGLLNFISGPVLFWLVMVLGGTCLLHFCVLMHRRRRVTWTSVFRIVSYGLVPLFVAILLHMAFLCVGDNALNSGSVQTLVWYYLLVICPFIWSYHLIKIALEECYLMSRHEASWVVFAAVLLTTTFFYFS